ncbi:OmpA family protein [Actinocorallia sp. B10E7]|uniref:OmpA family protein n=1 Tax=Actinocorallia sp. B10E7 TaxID=3153558 RepID=UPI00325CA0D2
MPGVRRPQVWRPALWRAAVNEKNECIPEVNVPEVTVPEATIPEVVVPEAVLKDAPPNTSIRVEGHTDAEGEDAFNQDLSDRRAKAIVEWLATRGGIPRDRLKATGYGETRPAADNKTSEGRARNRRVVISVDT